MKPVRKQFEALMQGDPQALAAAAVLAFLISVGWFSISFIFRGEDKTLPLGNSNPRPAEKEVILLSQVLSEQQELTLPETANPFYLKPPRKRPPQRPTRPPREKPPKPGPTPEENPPDNPPAPAPTITYVYQGLITRPDGVTVAMVQIPKEGSTRFVSVGDNLPPLTITGIFKEGLEYTMGNDRPGALSIGQTATFQIDND